MLVVDTSAALAALVDAPHVPELVALLRADPDLHVPHLIDVELVHALRRLVLAGQMTPDRAADARADFADLALVRYPHHPLADRMWALRNNLSAYDAAFRGIERGARRPAGDMRRPHGGRTGHHAQMELFRPSAFRDDTHQANGAVGDEVPRTSDPFSRPMAFSTTGQKRECCSMRAAHQ